MLVTQAYDFPVIYNDVNGYSRHIGIYAYHWTGALDQLEESHLSDVSQVSNILRIM